MQKNIKPGRRARAARSTTRIDISFTAKRSLVDRRKIWLCHSCASVNVEASEARVVTGLSATVYERAKYPQATTREFRARAWNAILMLLLSYVT